MAAPPPTLASVFAECAKVLDEAVYYNFVAEHVGEEFRQSIFCLIYDALVDDGRGCISIWNILSEDVEDVK
jgi:hypothetical protein